MKQQKSVIKKYTLFDIRIRSRHPSHDSIRYKMQKLPFRSVVRLGSTTEVDEKVQVECNSVQSIKNSSSKLLMKQCFTQGGVTTASWWTTDGKVFFINGKNEEKENINFTDLPYPLIVKSLYGSRGRGNSKINTLEELNQWIVGKDLKNYLFEAYKTYTREYRLHVTSEGYFYTCRKMLKKDTPEDKRFQRHGDNSVWILEENEAFDKPSNWNIIVQDCIRALNSLGLDIGAFDIKVQSAKDSKEKTRENPEWIIIESCSAPSFGLITAQRYIEKIPKVLLRKAKQQGIIN